MKLEGLGMRVRSGDKSHERYWLATVTVVRVRSSASIVAVQCTLDMPILCRDKAAHNYKESIPLPISMLNTSADSGRRK